MAGTRKNVCELEEEILKFWEKNKIYEKCRERVRGKKKFYFLDGPPYATGIIHIGTAMNKILKDTFLRFFRMLGYDVHDVPGYDTHGLPIENKVEKELGFKSKRDIERFGIENFIARCREFATRHIDTMSRQFANLGVWMKWDSPYLTLNNEYIEGAWYTFKKAYEKGLLYRGSYPVHVCWRCETVVAYNEIEYKKVEDPSIYVKFRVRENEYLIVWTTTPWTLPANVAVMVKPSAHYARVRVGDEIFIIAKDLVEDVMKKIGREDYEIIEVVKGEELKDTEYEHPFADAIEFQKNIKHKVVTSEQFVTVDEGTGLVHCAPGHGHEDYKVGLENGLPVISPVDMNGRYKEGCGELTGLFVKDADKKVIDMLRSRGLLLHEERIVHDYPFCWRCESPLIIITVPQWFFRVSAIRGKLLEENEKINWSPRWAKQRFRSWLENLGDWPISRQRYWGIPLPIWICDRCGEVEVIGSTQELPRVPKDIHRPYIDEITWRCKRCGSGTMRRVGDVLDVWFDSGVAPWASLNYPKNKELFERLWPVDLVLEGPDQIRGWWNSMMITSVMTFDRRAFDNVLFHGFVLDAHGVKMSKSKGNIVTPEEVIEKYGRDALRLYFLSSPPWEDYYFQWDDVEKVWRIMNIVENSVNFVKTYVKRVRKVERLMPEDEWILSRLNNVIKDAVNYVKNLRPHDALRRILDFAVEDFSRWYIKLVRDRVWIFYEGEDKDSACYTLHHVAFSLIRLLAPFAPFFTERMFREIKHLVENPEESIHLYSIPPTDEKRIDNELEAQMEVVREIYQSVLAARQEAGIKLRWPVRSIAIKTDSGEVKRAVNTFNLVLKRACNCRHVSVAEGEPEFNYVKTEFGKGAVFIDVTRDREIIEEAFVRELVRKIQDARKKLGLKVEQLVEICVECDKEHEEIIRKHFDVIKREVGAENVMLNQPCEYKEKFTFEGKTIRIAVRIPDNSHREIEVE